MATASWTVQSPGWHCHVEGLVRVDEGVVLRSDVAHSRGHARSPDPPALKLTVSTSTFMGIAPYVCLWVRPPTPAVVPTEQSDPRPRCPGDMYLAADVVRGIGNMFLCSIYNAMQTTSHA